MSSTDNSTDDSDDAVIGTALTASLVVILLLSVAAGLYYYYSTRTAPVVPDAVQPVVLPSQRELPQVTPPPVAWVDATRSAGIEFRYENGAAGEKLLPETMGGGAAFFDCDGDGDQDLLFVNGKRWSSDDRPTQTLPTLALYENDGSGKFKDVTAAWGLDLTVYGMGAGCGDYDGDGDIDLYITCVGKNLLLRNDGGKFVDVTEEAGVAGSDADWSTSCGWFDYDRDGDLDLFVCRYLEWTREFDSGQDFQLIGGGRAYGRPQNFGGTFPALYRNDGDGKFSEVSKEAGLQVVNPATGAPMGKSLGLVFDDFNGDGWPDVFVANDTVQNFLFVNQKDGTFVESGALSGVAFDRNGNARGAMGIDSSQFRNDAGLGVAIGNFSNEMTALYVARERNLQFYDEAVANGLGPATRLQLSFGLFFFDYDLDGRLDLFQANGHLEQDIQKVQASQRYQQSPQLFWNAGKEHATEFVGPDAESLGTDFSAPLVGRGAAYADIDGDGDLDLVIGTSGERPRLLVNQQNLGHHWLRVRLSAPGGNRFGLGSIVRLISADGVQSRTVSPTRSYISQMELPVTFGLGDDVGKLQLQVIWPDGELQEVGVPEADREIVVERRKL